MATYHASGQSEKAAKVIDTTKQLWVERVDPPPVDWRILLVFVGLVMCFVYGAIVIPPRIERATASGVAETLARAGFENLDVSADGQIAYVSGDATERDLTTIHAIARGALCRGPWSGQWPCADEVRVRITGRQSIPTPVPPVIEKTDRALELPDPVMQARAPLPGGQHHNLRFIKDDEGLTLTGQIPHADIRDQLLQHASAIYPAIVDDLSISGVAPAEGFDWAVDRIWPILERLQRGEISWHAGRLSVTGEVLAENVEPLKAAFYSPIYAERNADASLTVVRSPALVTACDRAYAEMLAETAIEFVAGTVLLLPDSERYLDRVAILTDQCPAALTITAHSSNQGSEKDNLQLTSARAQAILNALVARGVDSAALTARGLGSAEPLVDDGTPIGQMMNRRIEIRRAGITSP